MQANDDLAALAARFSRAKEPHVAQAAARVAQLLAQNVLPLMRDLRILWEATAAASRPLACRHAEGPFAACSWLPRHGAAAGLPVAAPGDRNPCAFPGNLPACPGYRPADDAQ